jgi:hypothetical protein
MSYQFDPSCHVASVSQSPQDTLLSCQASSCGNPCAQQILHMGYNSPNLGRFLPSGNTPSGDVTLRPVSFSPMPPIHSHNICSPRVIYPSSSYNYGNPGYYYDHLHHPDSMCTQTESPYVLHSMVQSTIYPLPTAYHPPISTLPSPSTPGMGHNFDPSDTVYREVSPVDCQPYPSPLP